ncbi:MAG: tRNA (adenosine(37)-N6)-dimethylallyltransferase MiaA [Coprococcus eutactus]|nr:tRNA (adenosine(37)-N6)-dimethylallyltransferase MiaA [Coprococcus eutactus]
MNNRPLIILTGPTAVGKTALSIGLAKAVDGEIISADSMQVYRKMNIGTAKIQQSEMQGVRHHLIDILDPGEDFNVVLFKKYALEAMKDIYSRGKIPVVVGGTGFYIQALLYDINFEDNDNDMSYREELQILAAEHGNSYIHDMLAGVDPESAEKIHENNVKRVIRALEFYKKTGTKISEHNEAESQKESPYNFEYFVLNDDRQKLYDRIDRRIDIMLEDGLLDEVRSLVDEGYSRDLVSMQGLGYKEMIDYIQERYTLDEAVYTLKRDTRHFAKRQVTWFKREKQVTWVNKNEFDSEADILSFMIERLREKEIIQR